MSGKLTSLSDFSVARLRLGGQHATFEIRRDCRACKGTLDLTDRTRALGWLGRLPEIEVGVLRGLLAQSGHFNAPCLTRQDVLREVADLLVRGRLCVCRIAKHEQMMPKVPSGSPKAAPSTPPAPFPLGDRRNRFPETTLRTPELEPPVFPGTADLSAIAEGLKKAAETGAPFCEECARLAKERAARQ
jgi:hypothetical protein